MLFKNTNKYKIQFFVLFMSVKIPYKFQWDLDYCI